MPDGYMLDWADRIQEELRRYDRRSMVGDTIMDQLLYIGSKLRMIRMGWEVWKKWVLEDLNHRGVDGEEIYEFIAEDYLEDREVQFMWVLDNKLDISIEVAKTGTTITLSKDGEDVCSAWVHDGDIVTYTDYVTNTIKSHRHRDYLTPTYHIRSFE